MSTALSSILGSFVLASAAWLVGCGSSVTASLTVDGAAFQPNDCRSGENREFLGADLEDDGGRMLRLVIEPDQTATIILFPEADQGSVTFKGCGVVEINRSDNDKYGDYTVDGSADLTCNQEGRSVVGTAQFSDCANDY